MAFDPKLIAILLSMLPTASSAQDHAFTALPAPAERPYPYEILGMQPGDSLDDVMAEFASRSDEEPTGESEMFGVSNRDGRSIDFEYERFRQIGGQTLHQRMAKEYHTTVTAELSTDVLGRRPISIKRSIRQASDELPTAQALQAQIEGQYGSPSHVETSNGTLTMIYAWGAESFIANLTDQAPRNYTFTERDGREIDTTIQPCSGQANGAYDGQTQYDWDYPRRLELMPGCTALFTVNHTTEPGTTTITFNITDYDLARQHRDELDRQIIEALTGEADVEASNMDL